MGVERGGEIVRVVLSQEIGGEDIRCSGNTWTVIPPAWKNKIRIVWIDLCEVLARLMLLKFRGMTWGFKRLIRWMQWTLIQMPPFA